MESLNSYISDGESDSSPCMMSKKRPYSNQEEVDANCEPITMDMSEDSSSEHSAERRNHEKPEAQKRYYSRSLSPSPPTSFSSDSSPDRKKKFDENRGRSRESVKGRRYDDEKRKRDRDYKREDNRDYKRDDDRDYRRDDDRDRRYRDSKDKYRDKDKDYDRYQSKRRDVRSRSHRSRSRSRSYNKQSSRRKVKSKSRSRSRDRHYKQSPRRSHKKHSPYRSRRSRSKSPSKEKSRSNDWKSSSKLKVLEKLGIEIKVPSGSLDVSQSGSNSSTSNQLTPQLLLQKTMEQQVEKVKSATGIELPSYYNPIAVNPTKYAEQIQKRRLLWGNKDKIAEEKSVVNKPSENKGSGTIWQGATFGGDQDGKMTAKFKRLMGIKDAKDNTAKVAGSDLIKKQEEMFHSMESQYEVARLATHSHRGLGLGFGTFQPR